MKMMRVILPLLALAAAAVFSSFFVVEEGFQALVTQFGKPVGGPYKEAGLYFKIPMIQEVHTFEKRILKWDGSPNQIPTRDKKYIWVDTTARWRIADPLRFLQTVSTERGALSRLDDIIDSVVRDLVSSNLLIELVRSADWDPTQITTVDDELKPVTLANDRMEERGDNETQTDTRVRQGRQVITRTMLAEAKKLTPEYGIELIDIRIKRINYVESVQQRVFERMISERKRIASQYRSEGEGRKQGILGQMRKELARIRSESYKKAQEIRGSGQAQSTEIYGKAYGADPEFYAFFKTLETYGETETGKTDLFLSSDNEYYKYLKGVPK